MAEGREGGVADVSHNGVRKARAPGQIIDWMLNAKAFGLSGL